MNQTPQKIELFNSRHGLSITLYHANGTTETYAERNASERHHFQEIYRSLPQDFITQSVQSGKGTYTLNT